MFFWFFFIEWCNYFFRGGFVIGVFWLSFGGKIELVIIMFDGCFEKIIFLRRNKYLEIIKFCIKNFLIERNE